MKLTSKLSILAAAILSLGLPSWQASADTSAAPGALASSGQGYSEIHGQPIEVGTRNRYEYGYKRLNLAANPLGAIVGFYGMQGSLAINSTIALRGDVTWYAPPTGGESQRGFEATGSVGIYFKHMYQGLFLEPGLMVRELETHSSDRDITSGLQVLVGYHWMWDSGLNVAVAAGVGRNLASNNYHEPGESFGNGYLRFGYAF